jgi:hypothetical protein
MLREPKLCSKSRTSEQKAHLSIATSDVSIFWDMTQCILVYVYGSFGGT